MNAVTIMYDDAGPSPAARPANEAGCTGTRTSARTLAAPARRLGALQRVAAAVAQGGAATEVFDLAAREAARLLRADDAVILRIGPQRDAVVCGRAWTTVGVLPACAAVVEQQFASWLSRDGGPIRLSGWRASLVFGRSRADALAVPICLGGQLHGAIAVGSDRLGGWDEDAIPSLQALAVVLAAALLATTARPAGVTPGDRAAHLARDVRRAIARGEVVLRYQPIVSLHTGQPQAFEALLRRRRPQRGVEGPTQLLVAAHAGGVTRELTAGVLRMACRDAALLNAARWDDRPLAVTVNLSGPQLDDGRLLPVVTAALQDHDVAAEQLWIEVTEDTIVSDGSARLACLQELRALGVKIALDDFGSGYASLAHVRRLPLDLVKLDRSLVREAAHGSADAHILAAAIEMARALRIEVVAEGCETAQQLALLQALGCGLVQGHHLSRPVDAQRAAQMVTAPLPWLEGGAALRQALAVTGRSDGVRGPETARAQRQCAPPPVEGAPAAALAPSRPARGPRRTCRGPRG